ncbi:MAG TPA: hypothetical protein DCZ72_07075 [Armatimonadetes bacterium]|nr:hypothetical protein [Armatimonadota bacterium]
MTEFIVGLLILALITLLSSLRVVKEYERAVVLRFGRFAGVRGPGIIFLLPWGIEQQSKVDVRTKTVDVEPQEAITKDSVTIRVTAVVWYRVQDPQRAVLRIHDFPAAVYQVALTTLRNVIGQHMLDELLRDRDKINDVILSLVAEATEAWGVAVEMVEMKDVEIPVNMQRAMAKEAEAAREKRARLIKAEAEEEASRKLTAAAAQIAANPAALELRRMQMLTEVGTEQNTTTIIMMPTEFVTMAQGIADIAQVQARLTEPASDQPRLDAST